MKQNIPVPYSALLLQKQSAKAKRKSTVTVCARAYDREQRKSAARLCYSAVTAVTEALSRKTHFYSTSLSQRRAFVNRENTSQSREYQSIEITPVNRDNTSQSR